METSIQPDRPGRRCACWQVALMLVPACAAVQAQEASVGIDKGADIMAVCGPKPTVVALVDGSGDNVWRRVTRAKFEDEARRCPNVAKVLYAEAGNDQQKYNAAIDAMAAQGANIIVTFTDYGDAALPAYRRAQKSGVTVVPYFGLLGGVAGKDYAANISFDFAKVGAVWADWIGRTVKSGNVVFLGGVAGSATSQQYLEGFRKQLQKYPGVKLLEDNYVVTNWNAADTQRAVSGLIARHHKIDGIVSDYAVEAQAAVKAFEQAGLPVPAQATVASFNELNCRYLAAKGSAKPWKYMSFDGTNRMVGFALRRGMAIWQGLPLAEPLRVMPYLYADSEQHIDPQCDPAAPLDADFSSGLPKEKLYLLFKR